MKDPWFGPKAYGIGVGPRNLAGLLATGAFVLAMATAPNLIAALHGPVWAVLLVVLAITAAFLVVVAKTS